jgi:hypothetical protein
MSHGLENVWTADDRFNLSNLAVPVPLNEQRRIEVLRKSKLNDPNTVETGFNRFTSLTTRLFNVSWFVSFATFLLLTEQF